MIVYTFGAWDILHAGHLKFLDKASELGDLVVGVQTDKAIAECKPESTAINQIQRLKLVNALKCVYYAELYDFDYIERYKQAEADILCMSEAHRYTERLQKLYKYVTDTGGKVVFLPYDNSVSSSEIKKGIRGWSNIWESVANSEKNDYEICGYAKQEDALMMAEYIRNRMHIDKYDRILDYGCGSGVIMEALNLNPGSIGIDVSPSMIRRAIKNNPYQIFFINRRPALMCNLDVVISWGVFQYLDNYEQAEEIIKDLLHVSKRILLMEIPDITKKTEREANRRELGMSSTPEHLYYSKEFFTKHGFTCHDNDIFLTKNARYSFTAVLKKGSGE